jgi:predicted ATP-binding protein involved in virulence
MAPDPRFVVHSSTSDRGLRMIQSISINGLRGIAKGEIKELAPLTVLVGPNSSGKSTILDACMLDG